jgi:ABC-type multidrug transport system fused ATPase/permease subunit
VLDRGVVVEEGNHTELMKKEGKYSALAKNQV